MDSKLANTLTFPKHSQMANSKTSENLSPLEVQVASPQPPLVGPEPWCFFVTPIAAKKTSFF